MKAKEKSKVVIPFDAGEIEFSVKSAIFKNTLPAVYDNWKGWLESFDVSGIETDEDFKRASEFVAGCKETEDKLEELEGAVLKGEAEKVLAKIRSMREATRLKRLEISKDIDYKKGKVKSDAIAAAVLKVKTEISGIKYRDGSPLSDIETKLREAIKGKSAILKMNEALESEVARILADAAEYNVKTERLIHEVTEIYRAAGEPSTDSEIDMIVRGYADGAPERAKLILDQKRVKRDQDAIDKKRREEEALKANPPATVLPEAATAPLSTRSALSEAAIPGAPVRILRFGATFNTTDPEQTISLINSIGGRDVKFVEPKK